MARLSTTANRPGFVLLIVMSMLALFATVGLSFVFYAESESAASRFRRQAEAIDMSDIPPEKLLAYFLSQQIYGPDNVFSALRGTSLADAMYGFPGGTTPFNGIGRLHDQNFQIAFGGTPIAATNKQKVVNLTWYKSLGEGPVVGGVPQGVGPQYPEEGTNVPYTYWDIHNPFLAQIDADGVVQTRSYDRGTYDLNDLTDPWQKYYTFRPHRSYHTNFENPSPGDADVRNLDGSKGKSATSFNDSFWIDIGFPVMTAKDGTKYKALFAPLILDLDGRVNMSVAGNPMADYTGAKTSSQGMGPWEINPAKVLSKTNSEMAKLFLGNKTLAIPGRLGNENDPAPDTDRRGSVSFPDSPMHARLDFTGISTGVMSLPKWTVATDPITMFPTYPGDWTNTVNARHPAGYDVLLATGDGTTATDTRVAASNMEALLRFGERGSPGLTSNLLRLFPSSLDLKDPTETKNRHLLTTFGATMDVAHIAPFFVDSNPNHPTMPTNPKYQLADDDDYPKSDLKGTGMKTTLKAPPDGFTSGEFSVAYQSKNPVKLSRMPINRSLTDYTANAAAAALDRQTFANEVYQRLVRMTGAKTDVTSLPDTDQEYRANRWLAQFAVNIVDFIDNDDVMTMFLWNTRQDGTKDYVFGVEHPRVLVNEAYASFDNAKGEVDLPDPAKGKAKGKSKSYRLNVWVELFDPMKNDPYLRDNGAAYLNKSNKVIYRIALTKKAPADSDDPTGVPSTTLSDKNGTQSLCDDWANNAGLTQGDGQFKDTVGDGKSNGFFLVGPTDTFLDDPKYKRKPTMPTMGHTSEGMSCTFDFPGNNDDKLDLFDPSVVLQRLANPYLPEQPDAMKADYNPFVTVDVFPNVKAYDSIQFRDDKELSPEKISTFASQGRKQPMQASVVKNQNPKLAAGPSMDDQLPKHTLGRHNSQEDVQANIQKYDMATNPDQTIDLPFDWMPHADRPLQSTAELIHVANTGPHLVTKRFQNTALSSMTPPKSQIVFNALADRSSLLVRLFEAFSVPDRTFRNLPDPVTPTKQLPAIRSPGKINLNTYVDKKVLQALLDPRSDSTFTSTQVDALDSFLSGNRPMAGFSNYRLSSGGGGTDIEFRITPLDKVANGSATSIGGGQLYKDAEIFRKLMNNVTFTSNAFAVWVTVGFFEVENDTVYPAKLGKEIGKAENRHVRHRMFAIVDRSSLVVPDQPLTSTTGNVTADPMGVSPTTVVVAQASGKLESTTPKVTYNWTLKKGMRIVLERGTANEESVDIVNVTGTTIAAVFKKNHPAGPIYLDGINAPQSPFPGTMFGHPGPQPEFNLRDYYYVVPHWSVID